MATDPNAHLRVVPPTVAIGAGIVRLISAGDCITEAVQTLDQVKDGVSFDQAVDLIAVAAALEAAGRIITRTKDGLYRINAELESASAEGTGAL